MAEELKTQDAERVDAEIAKTGYYSLHTNAGTFDITPAHFSMVEKHVSETATQFRHGLVTIDATQTEELKEELFLREITRRIQMIRKDMGLRNRMLRKSR